MTRKIFSYIMAAIIVLVSAHYLFQRIAARMAEVDIYARHELTLVTNQVFYTGTDLVAMVHVRDLQGQPVKADLDVSLMFEDTAINSLVFNTDYDGSSNIIFPLHGAQGGRYQLYITVNSDISTENFVKDISITHAADQNIIIHFDKGLYKPGDDVLFRILAVNSVDARPFAGGHYTISIFDGNDNRVYFQSAQTSDFGIISGRFRLADEVNSGFYRLLVERDGRFQAEAFFEVAPYVLPRFEIILQTDKDEYNIGDTIYITGDVRYFFGEPVNQGIVNAYVNGRRRLDRVELDENGRFSLSYFADVAGLYNIWVEVIDNSNFRVEQTASVRAAEGPFDIELLPEHGYLVVGMPNRVYVFTNRADGTPVRAFLQISGRGFSRQVATDDNGMGFFVLEDAAEYNQISVRGQDAYGNSIEREFDFSGITRNIALSVNAPRFAMNETIYLTMHSRERGGTFVIHAYRNDRLLTMITTRYDRAQLRLDDIYGLIDIYAVWLPPGGNIDRLAYFAHARKTVFIDPGSFMQLTVQSDRPEYRPGEFVSLSFGVTDDIGNPLEAALLVSIVDEAMLSLAANDLSIDNIRLALADIRFSEDLDAATLYASLIAGASEQAITRILLRQGETSPFIQTSRLYNEPVLHRYSLGELMAQATFNALRFLLLTGAAITFFLLRVGPKKAPYAPLPTEFADMPPPNTPPKDFAEPITPMRKQRGEKASFWAVIAAIVVFLFALFFMSSCGAADTARDAVAEAPAHATPTPDAAPAAEAAPAPMPATTPPPAQTQPAEDFIDTDVSIDEIDTQTARVRRLFLETMLFIPELIARDGQADLHFMLADNITTWNIQVVGNTRDGLVGHTESSIRAFQPFFVDFELPRNSIRHDQISIPVTVFNYTEQEQTVILTIAEMGWFTLQVPAVQTLVVPSNQSQMVYVPIIITDFGDFVFRAYADTHNFADAAERGLRVNPEGFHITRVVSSGTIENSTWQHLLFLDEHVDDTRRAHIKFYPSAMAQVIEGMENIFRMPMGCFEQTSSMLYPNILALRYMQNNNIDNPQLTERALRYISSGYQRLLTFEVPGERGGFSLYGHAPAETVLTAYGLMQLKNLTEVYTIDERVLDRMADFLFDKQNADGSFQITGRRAGAVMPIRDHLALNAYITWALSEAFPQDRRLDNAVNYLLNNLDVVDDNYTLALIANALVNTGNPAARQVIDELHGNIMRDNGFAWITATSRDYFGAHGHTQELQTTALTSLALSGYGAHADTNNLLVNHLIAHRDSWGTWHSTQATILSLKALTRHATASPLEDGQITVTIGDQQRVIQIDGSNTLDFYQVSFSGLARENIIEIDFPNLGRMVYQIVLDYFVPYDSVELDRGFEIIAGMNTQLSVHELVEQEIRIINRTPHLVSNGLVAISIPQGFRVETSSLTALQHRGLIERYEMRFDNINLYLRYTEPGEIIDLTIAYRPAYPVIITGGHMRVFDYYNPSTEGFLKPFEITVRP